MTVLITGGTGSLGRPTVERLRAANHDLRVLSRHPGPDHVVGDLSTGESLAAAVDGVRTILHLATSRGTKDSAQTGRLIEACRTAGVEHVIYISIVGVEEVPYFYYNEKVRCERLIERSGIPFTILRATQFHDFVAELFTAQRRLPVLFAPNLPVQPIAVDEVAARLAELAARPAAGRVADIGGPQQLTLPGAAEIWRNGTGSSKPIWKVSLAGKTFRAFKAGHHLTALPGYGRETFAEHTARAARSH